MPRNTRSSKSSQIARNEGPLPTHEEVVRQLLLPQAYPGKVADVRLVQTHISSLFFTSKHVYKVKRPVNYGFLDFTTLAKRRYYCRQEVVLNQRLSPQVYLGVVEIREQDGRLSIEGQGRTVEYAVKMRQLPNERSLATLLQKGEATAQDLRRLGGLVANFHRNAMSTPAITRQGGLKAVVKNVRENFRQTKKYVGLCLTQDTYDDIVAYNQAFMAEKEDLFHRREAKGCIRDCHGDMQAADIFFVDGIQILDCIEFNRRFRYGDVASEVAFLAMDLEFHHRSNLAQAYVQAYIGASQDNGLMEMLDFYKCYRAYVRAKVTSFRLDDPTLPAEQRQEVIATAQAYYNLAHSYAGVIPQPSLFLVIGLMGTGKSTVAEDLARRRNAAYISSDITRKNLASVAPTEHRYESFGQGIYAPGMSRDTYDTMVSQARDHLARGRSVVLDATFRSTQDRQRAVDAARSAGVETWIVECTAPVEVIRRRVKQRQREGSSVSDARWELFHQQQAEWEPVHEVPTQRYILLDTSHPRQRVFLELLQRLYAGALRS